MPHTLYSGYANLPAALESIARAIADSLEVKEVWERVAAACRTVVPFDHMGIAQLEAGGRIRIIAIDGEMKELEGQVFERTDDSIAPFWDERPFVVRDGEQDFDPSFALDRAILEAGYRSSLGFSLSHRGERFGNFGVLSRTPGRFTEEHARMLGLVAELVAVALAHEQLATTLAQETRRSAAEHERAALLEQRVQLLAQELETLSPHRALGDSPRWRDVLEQAAKVAPTDTTVLLTGESGTGKEVVARFIHRGSPRKDAPFIALNCAALPEQLLESELFGHERGAFTGAQAARAGRIEQAARGVLFLDEVAEMSTAVQAKFLRVLEEREYQRLGGTRTLKADVRVLAATNRDLKAAIAGGTFREDLYYRLAVFDIALPPLRDRPEDIPLLTKAFLDVTRRTAGRAAAGISAEAHDKLLVYAWPGNVRELRNVIERAAILCEGGMITSEHLPLDVRSGPAVVRDSSGTARVAEVRLPTAGAAEAELIRQALARSGNNKSKAARLLGMTRAQLRSRIEKHGLAAARGVAP